MYPKVFTDFAAYLKKYGDVSPVPTDVMFYGLRKGEETEVEIEKGKTLFIQPAGGQRAQRARHAHAVLRAQRPPARGRGAGPGASARRSPPAPRPTRTTCTTSARPCPARWSRSRSHAGDEVKEGDKLVVLEAMKMEMTLASPLAGVIKEITVKPKDRVDAGDLLVVFK